jgi:hypothetical protein
MAVKLKLSVNDKQIQATLTSLISREIDARITRSIPSITKYARSLIAQSFLSSPEVPSLLRGKLQQDFGLTSDLAQSAVNEILSALIAGVSVKTENVETSGVLSYLKSLVWKEKSIILSVYPNPELYKSIQTGSYISSTDRDINIDWLEWLMTRGTEIIVTGYQVKYDPKDPSWSRSNSAIMIKRKNGAFRVDPEFSGTLEDNFITRAISTIIPELQRRIIEELK